MQQRQENGRQGGSHPERISADVLLAFCRRGDREALNRLYEVLYRELRIIARKHLRELRRAAGHTLDTTALVNESYLKLAGAAGPGWPGKAQFFAVASKAMRHILVDRARRRAAGKRDGGLRMTWSDAGATPVPAVSVDILALDRALETLADHLPRLEAIVECRFFGGMTVDETAAALDISRSTVERDWIRARAYLTALLRSEGGPAE